MKTNHKQVSASLFVVVMIIGTITTGGAFSSAYAEGAKDKDNKEEVKVGCNDVAIALATLSLAYGDLDKDGKDMLEEELQEGDIARNVDEIRDNLQNVLDTVNDKCDDVDFIGFVDFESEDFVVD